jgi:hypothetical protein
MSKIRKINIEKFIMETSNFSHKQVMDRFFTNWVTIEDYSHVNLLYSKYRNVKAFTIDFTTRFLNLPDDKIAEYTGMYLRMKQKIFGTLRASEETAVLWYDFEQKLYRRCMTVTGNETVSETKNRDRSRKAPPKPVEKEEPVQVEETKEESAEQVKEPVEHEQVNEPVENEQVKELTDHEQEIYRRAIVDTLIEKMPEVIKEYEDRNNIKLDETERKQMEQLKQQLKEEPEKLINVVMGKKTPPPRPPRPTKKIIERKVPPIPPRLVKPEELNLEPVKVEAPPCETITTTDDTKQTEAPVKVKHIDNEFKDCPCGSKARTTRDHKESNRHQKYIATGVIYKKQTDKERRDRHVDKYENITYTCECGVEVKRLQKYKHQRTLRHKDFINDKKSLPRSNHMTDCPCGSSLLKYQLPNHVKSRKHLKYLEEHPE